METNLLQDTRQASKQEFSDVRRWLVIVVLVALLERLLILVLYQPVPYSDTPSYRRLAEAVLGGFKQYDGTRVPGYPVFLALIGPDERVWLIQMALGVAITLLLFFIGWRISNRGWFAALVALVHTLNLGQLFFESNLLTETLATFCVVLVLAGTLIWLTQPAQRSIWLAFGLGLVSSLALITRPQFIYLPFWILPFLVLKSRAGRHPGLRLSLSIHWTWACAFLVPVILIVGAWVGFMRTHFGDWALTTMTGYHLIQHTGDYFQYVSDEYALLRDTYLSYRDEHIARFGTQANTIWEAIPAMQAASGLSFYDLSRTLARISTRLILEHPMLYLKNALEGWWLFWRAPVYWSPETVRWEALAIALHPIILLERIILFSLNLFFIGSSLLVTCQPRLLPAKGGLRSFFWCLLGTIWIGSIVQTLLDHGDNPRFLVPLQSLVTVWVFWIGWQWLEGWIKKWRNPT